MPARVRVIAPFNARGVYLLSIVLGAVLGPLMMKVESWTFRLRQLEFAQRHLTSNQANVLALVLIIGAAFVPGLLIGAWFSCVSQRRGRMAIAAALAGACALLAGLLADKILWAVDGGTDWEGWPPLAFLMNLVIIAGMNALAALLVRWLIRVALFTTLEQDGHRCTGCGYDLGNLAIRMCPECGRPADSMRLAFRRLHASSAWMQRWAPAIAAALGLAALVPLGFAMRFRTLPALRFFGAFPREVSVGQGVMIPRTMPANGTVETACIASWKAVAGEPVRGIVVLYVPDRRSALPAMRLAVAAPIAPAAVSQWGPRVDYGSTEVGCDLPRELAERVVREGIPPGLVKALMAEADAAKWGLVATPTGMFDPSSTTRWIDPAPWFSGR